MWNKNTQLKYKHCTIDTIFYSSKHIPQILIKSYITTYCSDVVRSLVPNVPEDLFDYMGTQVRTKQTEEKGCFTSSTVVIILEKCNFLWKNLLKVVSLGPGEGLFFKAIHVYGYPFQMWLTPPWQMCNNSTGMFMSIKIIKKLVSHFPFTTHIFVFTTHTRWFCIGHLQEYSPQKLPVSRSYQSHTTYTICIT